MAEIKRFPTNKVYNYLYRFEVEFFIPDTDIKIVPRKILHAIKDSNYLNNFMPTLKMEMLINKRSTFKLQKHQHELLAKITLTSYKYITRAVVTENASGAGELVDTQIEFSEIFEPLFDPESFPTHYRTEEHEDDRIYSKDPDRQNITNETMIRPIMCNFYNITGISLNKTMFNTVIADSTVGSALLYVLYLSGIKHAIVDPPINESEYSNIILPPHNLRSTIEELQTRYGLYENGLLTFYDFNILYVLDKFAKKHEFEKNDSMYSQIQIFEADQTPTFILDIYEDDDHILYYNATIVFEKSDSSVASGEIEGNAFMFSNYKMGINSVIYKDGKFHADKAAPASTVLLRDVETHKSSGQKIIADYDELSNPYNIASYFNSTETLKNQYYFSLTGVNIKSFKPNKFLNMVFDNVVKNQKFGGFYIMTRNTLTFSLTSEISIDLICNADITLTRKI